MKRSHIYSILSCFKNNYISLVSWESRKIRSIIHAIKVDLLNGILVIWDLLSTFIKKVYLIYIFVKIIQCERKIVTHFLSSGHQLSHAFQIGPCEFPNVNSYITHKNGNSLFFSFLFTLLIAFTFPFTIIFNTSFSCKMSFSWMMYMGWRERHSANEPSTTTVLV